ncbi:MAG: hypothetical protein EXR64_02995 [Dehalococcoidia bacterium]|nr:hypothetical protein [Dehalococcoidia bacterium]
MRTILEVLSDAKRLAAEYYEITGRPLGITGEIAEYEAASKLGLELGAARTPGYDATARDGKTVQIKGRLLKRGSRGGRVGAITRKHRFDSVVLVLLDERLDPIEMFEASYDDVAGRLDAPGSRARNERGQLDVAQFKSIARRVWPADPQP